jgi:hypothetical protein
VGLEGQGNKNPPRKQNICEKIASLYNVPSVSEVLQSRIWAKHSGARYALLGDVVGVISHIFAPHVDLVFLHSICTLYLH